MATDSASPTGPNASATADNAYISPTVDFVIVLASMSALALIGAAVILP